MFSSRCSRFITNFNYVQAKQQIFSGILRTNSKSTCVARVNIVLKRWLSTQLINDGKLIIVRETEGRAVDRREMKFPTVWLRDNCQCSECFHDTTKSRKINWERCSNETAIRAAQVTVDSSKNAIIIDWQDAHKSKYDLKWLKQRDFSPEQRKKYTEEVYKPKEIIWGKQDYNKILKIYDFHKIITNDSDLYNWLKSLAVYGVTIIKDAPHDRTVSRQLADRIGFIKRTTYGEEFEVKSKENARNYAYLMTPLPLHIDMPYYEYIAGINILHCLVQSKSQGGANLLTDGFYVAEQLKQNYPKYFEILLKTPVDWYDIGKDSGMEFHNIWREPVINLDTDGRYHRINHNTTKRDSHFTVPLEVVDLWYEAYDKFLQIAYASTVELKTNPGEVFVFNNRRILHGRTAYSDSAENKRHLIGAYVDWDIIYSKMRILKANLEKV
ncbi:hypothetical protein FF38_00992 [Lucilia cuprina]|uniref:Gamma-butyrobetaine dioxygenase n=1 Tax=Lucilia cuprina TaxID=7375 RepID=A0A0L0C003_LUCCU|nr:Gamma-butyrobetaine dioxygenase [Lucilia cuprina]KNC24799.1 hypothetical protein FF38_00992 [Lucilia cuprina]